MIPSGKFPTAVNLLSNSLMDHYRFTVTTATGDNTLTGVTSSDFDYIRVGDLITGTGIPAATTIVSTDATAGEIVISANATANGTVTATSGNSDGWIINVAYNSVVSAVIGGNFGGIYQKLSLIAGTVCEYYADAIDLGLGSSAVGDVYSFVAWLSISDSTTASFAIRAYEEDAGGSFIGGAYHDCIISDWAATNGALPVVLSFAISDANTRKLRLIVRNFTQGASLNIDAVQLIAMKDIPSSYQYISTVNSIAPGYISIDHGSYEYPTSNLYITYSDIHAFLIPLISNEIGPWFCDTLWCYNWQYKSWSCWELPAITAASDINSLTADDLLISQLQGTVADIQWHYDDRLVSDKAPSVVIVPPDAQISEISAQYSYDWQGSAYIPILSYWQSKDFNIDLPDMDKTVSRVTLFHDVGHAVIDVMVSVSVDGGTNWVRQLVPIRTGQNATFADFFVTGSQARFEVRAVTPGFKLTGFSLKLIPRGEANAY
jgi:hypothetical protein